MRSHRSQWKLGDRIEKLRGCCGLKLCWCHWCRMAKCYHIKLIKLKCNLCDARCPDLIAHIEIISVLPKVKLVRWKFPTIRSNREINKYFTCFTASVVFLSETGTWEMRTGLSLRNCWSLKVGYINGNRMPFVFTWWFHTRISELCLLVHTFHISLPLALFLMISVGFRCVHVWTVIMLNKHIVIIVRYDFLRKKNENVCDINSRR